LVLLAKHYGSNNMRGAVGGASHTYRGDGKLMQTFGGEKWRTETVQKT
jgi:hypothetical protein